MTPLRILNERTMFKILVNHDGALLSITTKRCAYFFFLTRVLVGARIAPTTDPFPGIVELSGYDIPKIVSNWKALSRAKVVPS